MTIVQRVTRSVTSPVLRSVTSVVPVRAPLPSLSLDFMSQIYKVKQ